jgi:hypothetical protein
LEIETDDGIINKKLILQLGVVRFNNIFLIVNFISLQDTSMLTNKKGGRLNAVGFGKIKTYFSPLNLIRYYFLHSRETQRIFKRQKLIISSKNLLRSPFFQMCYHLCSDHFFKQGQIGQGHFACFNGLIPNSVNSARTKFQRSFRI